VNFLADAVESICAVAEFVSVGAISIVDSNCVVEAILESGANAGCEYFEQSVILLLRFTHVLLLLLLFSFLSSGMTRRNVGRQSLLAGVRIPFCAFPRDLTLHHISKAVENKA